MNFLEERIIRDGIVKPGNVLKVDSFLNHQMDISLMVNCFFYYVITFGIAIPLLNLIFIRHIFHCFVCSVHYW